jgi:hypothetical protein
MVSESSTCRTVPDLRRPSLPTTGIADDAWRSVSCDAALPAGAGLLVRANEQ